MSSDVESASAGNVADLDRVSLAPPTTAADVASIKHDTLHVSRYLRSRWKPEWSRAGLSPSNVQATFSHLMAVRKLQDLDCRGEVPTYAGQINRLGLSFVLSLGSARGRGILARDCISGAQFHYTMTEDLAIMASVFDSQLWLLIKEKLRCKGLDVAGAAPQALAAGPADARQQRLDAFFA